MFSFSGWAHDLMDQMMNNIHDDLSGFGYVESGGAVNHGYHSRVQFGVGSLFAVGLNLFTDGGAEEVGLAESGSARVASVAEGVRVSGREAVDRVPHSGLVSPERYFSGKSYSEMDQILTEKFGSPRGSGEYNKSFYNKNTGRTFNLHEDPMHRGGRPHVDIRRRGLPTNYYKDRPFYLNGGD